MAGLLSPDLRRALIGGEPGRVPAPASGWRPSLGPGQWPGWGRWAALEAMEADTMGAWAPAGVRACANIELRLRLRLNIPGMRLLSLPGPPGQTTLASSLRSSRSGMSGAGSVEAGVSVATNTRIIQSRVLVSHDVTCPRVGPQLGVTDMISRQAGAGFRARGIFKMIYFPV